MANPEQPSIWKKEITFRKKPKAEKGVPAPPPAEQPAKPESVAELLRPLAEHPLDPVVLPPVTPPVSAPPTAPLEAPQAPPAAAEVMDTAPEAAAEGTFAETAELRPAPEPAAPVLPVPEPEEPAVPEGKPSRRERKDMQRAADRLAREQAQRAKQSAKEQRKQSTAHHKQVVGLKIGASQLAAAHVYNKGVPRVVRMARMPLERGIVVGGELREPEELVGPLKTFFRKNKLPRSCVRLGISNNRIGVRTFEITGIEDPKQLANAIRFRAQETLPIPLDEAVLDYRVLEETVGEDGVRTRRVLLVVAHRDLVDRYVTACRKAGLKLIGIDLEAFGLLRALADPAQPQSGAEDAGVVCVSIGHDRSTLAVSDGRVCDFTRVLDLTPSEAEPIKRELVLGHEGEAAGLDARRAELARRAIAAELQVFARELVASLRFYQEQPGSLGIGEILVTGGGAAGGGLVEELERLIGVTVRHADPLGRVKVSKKLRKAANGTGGSLAVAVGLGIED